MRVIIQYGDGKMTLRRNATLLSHCESGGDGTEGKGWGQVTLLKQNVS